MIFLEVYGRLGNQMFRYAMARALQNKFYSDEQITISFNYINGNQSQDGSFRNELSNFNVVNFEVYSKSGKIIRNETNLFQKIVYYFCRLYVPTYNPLKMESLEKKMNRLNKVLNKSGIYWTWVGFQKPERTCMSNKIISGNFESPDYFEDIRDSLLEEFTPKYPVLAHNLDLYNTIIRTNSVCISVRRGDFVSNKKIGEIHNVVNEKYFNKAISYMNSILENPTYVLFSDDIEWAKKNINFGEATCLAENGDDPVWEKLRLMYSCKHFVISNSSFSWWAQYLGRYDNKIVISPTKWFNNNYKSELLMDDFVKLNT